MARPSGDMGPAIAPAALGRILPRPVEGDRILAIADNTTVTVIDLETGEILSTHTIDPTKTYWRNTQRAWADGPELSRWWPMSRLR